MIAIAENEGSMEPELKLTFANGWSATVSPHGDGQECELYATSKDHGPCSIWQQHDASPDDVATFLAEVALQAPEIREAAL